MMSESLTLFHISDVHFGLEDPDAIGWAAECVTRERPAAIALTGDLTMRARRHEFAAACRWISSLQAPVTVEIGNHDMPYFNLAERFINPFKRFLGVEAMVECELNLPGLALIPLKTATRAQWRFPWSNGWVRRSALKRTLDAIDALPPGTRALVTCHHPLTERSPDGKLLTIGGDHALEELAARPQLLAVLSGHVHDPFDLVAQTPAGPVRMIGAGTLSRRIRSTPASFNELTIEGGAIRVKVRNLEQVPTLAMQLEQVPKDALPPRTEGEPVAPVGAVPAVDPPVH
ncbi:MAG: metallophosphoesterase [Novosphingobium sp.]